MKTRELFNKKNLNNVYEEDRINFCPVDGYTLQGYATKCKEEIGSQAVKERWYKFVVRMPHGALDDTQVNAVLEYVNEREKEAKVKATTIERVKDRPCWLLVTHSPRWSRNSVAHSILITWVRFALAQQADMYHDEEKDEAHLVKCYWLLNILKKKGLRVFGTQQHERYDVGMVSFMRRIRTDLWGTSWEDEPLREDYGTYEEWEDALMEFEDNQDTDSGLGMGDLDGNLPDAPHAYTKLMEIYKG
jgi:hypothetical protein